MGYKADRTAEDIKREITALIRELKDPRINSLLLTVVRAQVAHDLSYCKAYISSLGGIEEARRACKALNENAKNYIRKEVFSRLSLRKMPDMRFIADDSVEKGIEIFRVLNEKRRKDD